MFFKTRKKTGHDETHFTREKIPLSQSARETVSEKLMGVTKGILKVPGFEDLPVFVRSVGETSILLEIHSALVPAEYGIEAPECRFESRCRAVFSGRLPVEVEGMVSFAPLCGSAVLVFRGPDPVREIQRREAFRIEAMRKVTFRRDDGSEVSGHTTDISFKGFRAFLPADSLEQGKCCPVEMDLDDEVRGTFVATLIHRCEKEPGGKKCLYGFAFTMVTPDENRKLREFIMRLQRKKTAILKKGQTGN